MPRQDNFAQLVSLACHDLRTPLATVSGFAHTLARLDDLGQPAGRYVEMIQAASEQMADLLGELSLVAKIEAGRYEPTLVDADTLELSQAAAGALGDAAEAAGRGAAVRVEREATERALEALARCALRHGGIERVEIRAEGSEVAIAPVRPEVAPVILSEQLKDLGAASARRLVEALGGSLAIDGETLRVRLARQIRN